MYKLRSLKRRAIPPKLEFLLLQIENRINNVILIKICIVAFLTHLQIKKIIYEIFFRSHIKGSTVKLPLKRPHQACLQNKLRRV